MPCSMSSIASTPSVASAVAGEARAKASAADSQAVCLREVCLAVAVPAVSAVVVLVAAVASAVAVPVASAVVVPVVASVAP